MSTEEKNRAKEQEQARAQLDSIIVMVKRLDHCQECNGSEDCKLTDAKIFAGINNYYEEGMKASKEDREKYHDEENARESIRERPLSVEVRSGWHTPGENEDKPTEYRILLCTGGPAVRIIGELDKYQQPENAKLQFQDWFTPWEEYTDTTSEEDQALLTYAQEFYFGD
jgi:hypothetical protein